MDLTRDSTDQLGEVLGLSEHLGDALWRVDSSVKQLAGNSGYHFQLLNSVIEVNELQKRRVIARPRPVPPNLRVVDASACVNG